MYNNNDDTHELISNCYKVRDVTINCNLELNGDFTVFKCNKTGDYVLELDSSWFNLIDNDNQVVGTFSAELSSLELLFLTEAGQVQLDQNSRTSSRMQYSAFNKACSESKNA